MTPARTKAALLGLALATSGGLVDSVAYAERLYPVAVVIGVAEGQEVPKDDVKVASTDRSLLDKQPLCRSFDPKRPLRFVLELDQPRWFSGLKFRAFASAELPIARQHGRIAAFSVSTDAGKAELTLDDPMTKDDKRAIEYLRSESTYRVGRPTQYSYGVLEAVKTKTVSITIERIHPGTKAADVCLSNLRLFETAKPEPIKPGEPHE